MHTRRSFLAMAAAAPLASPLARAAANRSRRTPGAAPNRLPDVLLQTHDGRDVHFYNDLVKGRLVVLNMMYANCANICPPNTANLLRVQETLGGRIGRDVFMYSLTLQPAIDKPADLRRYMDKYGIEGGWTFLTGQPRDVELLRFKLGFYNANPVTDADLRQHTGMVRIGHDGRDRWSMIPAQASTAQIVTSIMGYL
ncbi:MAG: SCO1/SenC family protein [Massilia sp.]|nr:SCO1/SenC family protein [Massilia sp.]MDB5792859.1 SCO1/SenC family protein [Massilia sp.]